MPRKTGKTHLQHFFLCLFFSLFSGVLPVMAQQICQNNAQTDRNTPVVQAVIRQLGAQDVLLAACMPSPVHINQTYVVLVRQEATPVCLENDRNCNGNLALLLVDRKSGAITRSYTDRGTLAVNKSTITNVMIDKSTYQLNPSVRASGVLIEREQPLPESAIVSTELHLFTESGNRFLPVFSHSLHETSEVLAGLLLTEDEKSRNNKVCEHYRSKVTRNIDFGTYHSGIRDLIVQMAAYDITSAPDNSRGVATCAAQTIATTTGDTTIPYNGQVYLLPIWLTYPR